METLLLAGLALLAGAGLPVQASVNSELRQHLGRPEWATLANFAVGLVAVVAVLLLERVPLPPLAAVARAPWWAWTGGTLGAFFVVVAVILTPRLGVATTLALIIAGQLVAAIVLDHTGALGLAVRAATPARVAGALLLLGGVILMQR